MKWDLFVSHASEDKSFVTPLVRELEARGFRVWYDETRLRIGQSLRRSIDEGLIDSRFGVVVISPHFLAKEWPQKELDGLVAREVDGTPVVLPVWHGVDFKMVRSYSPTLADRIAIVSSVGVLRVADAIVQAFSGPAQDEKATERQAPQDAIAHLSLSDSRVLRLICEGLLQSGDSFIRSADMEPQAAELGLDRQQVLEAIDVLDHENLIRVSRALGGVVIRIRLTSVGFSLYARHFVHDYKSLKRDVAESIRDWNLRSSDRIADHLQQAEVIVKFVLRELEADGHLILSGRVGQHEKVAIVHPGLSQVIREAYE